ncbi:tyrosine-type recombinase/integrase [Methylobacterium fujisawaense]|uniref:tyrosine-type recombinase/integrase n=1 Tax=Methylobacterium fujisawaense TaxID=107400 RepID=UPI00313CB0BD
MTATAALPQILEGRETTLLPRPRQGIVDLAGLPVDCSGPVWRIHEATSYNLLDWSKVSVPSPTILEVTADYIISLISSRSPSHVRNAFETIKAVGRLTIFADQCLANTRDPGCSLDAQVFFHARDEERWRKLYLVHLRAWFAWCSTRCSAFDRQAAIDLRNTVIKTGPTAAAVRAGDPDKGPLDDVETTLLLNALRAALERDTLPASSLAIVWLCILFGANPRQLALLREDDLVVRDDGLAELRIPRMKKRDADVRTQFRSRKLDARALAVIRKVLRENDDRRSRNGWPDPDFARPLFPRRRPRTELMDGVRRAYAMHPTAAEIGAIVKDTVAALDVRSPRTGEPLHMTPRRFRYLFATRLLREGASPRAVADLLDHTDLQSVQSYVNLKGDIVEKLDAAVALDLAPLAQAFMGKLVAGEHAATRGGDRASRIFHADSPGADLEGVGTCGNFAFCGLAAPRACYVCVHFQPWIDAPHEHVLRSLAAERAERQAAGLGPRMVALNDDLILAVADVVHRCALLHADRAKEIGSPS